MVYRRDIDGLRAIAVIAVILFHFGYIKGGFVGVDVFFVISGYLITKLINDDVSRGTFSIVDFYFRRIRRIFPALFVLYFAVLLVTFLFTFSPNADDVTWSLRSSLVFVSNLFFYGGSGYFEDRNALRPLLHTWSLSVEEQFYIVLPILIYLLGRFTASIRHAAVGILAIISFAAAVWMVREDPAAAFYMMQFRAWELLMGSLLAIGIVPEIRRSGIAEALGITGLTLVIVSALNLTRNLPFPGLTALPACLGAALVIHSGRMHATQVSRLLSTKGAVFIGLISYSLYLWHWPILNFYQYIVASPDHPHKILLILGSVGMATLSWRYVETPFRKMRLQSPRWPVFVTSAAMMAVVAGISLPVGLLIRTVWAEPPLITSTLGYLAHKNRDMRGGTCFLHSEVESFEEFDRATCLTPSKDKPNFLIVGDSHAAHLAAGLAGTYPNINFMQATASGCRPIANTGGKSDCKRLRDFVFDQFLPQHHIDGLIIASRWNDPNVEALKRTVRKLTAVADRIIVVGPIVEYKAPLPLILAKAIRTGDKTLIDKYRRQGKKELDKKMAEGLKDTPAEYISIYSKLCAPDCIVWVGDNVPLQFDYGHLTTDGSYEVARRLRSQLFPESVLTIRVQQ